MMPNEVAQLRTMAEMNRRLRRELYGIFAPYCRREKDA